MSKQRTRLKPHEAIALGFELKKDYKSEGNPKFYLSESQIKNQSTRFIEKY